MGGGGAISQCSDQPWVLSHSSNTNLCAAKRNDIPFLWVQNSTFLSVNNATLKPFELPTNDNNGHLSNKVYKHHSIQYSWTGTIEIPDLK